MYCATSCSVHVMVCRPVAAPVLSAAGGFTEAHVGEMMSSAGFTLDSFDSTTLHITKPIEQEDGSQKLERFEVFMAVAGKAV